MEVMERYWQLYEIQTTYDSLYFQSGMQMTNLGYDEQHGAHSPQHDYDLPLSNEQVSRNKTCTIQTA